MQIFMDNLSYILITIYLTMLALSILSMRTIFRKIRFFGLGLCLVSASLITAAAANYLFGFAETRQFNSVMIISAIIGWLVAWAIDLGYYERDI